MDVTGKLVCVKHFGTRRAVIVPRISYSAFATNRKGGLHMLITDTTISSTQKSFGIAGLTRSELHEVQLLIDALRKFNSEIERTSEQAGHVERATDRTEHDEAERSTATTDSGMAPQPGRSFVRVGVKQSVNKSNAYPMKTLTRKERAITGALMQRAERGEFLAVRNLFVLVPNTPKKVDAEPDIPDRQ